MPEVERAKRMQDMVDALKPPVDESRETPGRGIRDYDLDGGKILRLVSSNIETYVTFARDGQRTEKVGWVGKPTQNYDDYRQTERMYEMARELNPKDMRDLYAIEQTVYMETPELLGRVRKRRRSGLRTPAGATPGGVPAPMTPGFGPMLPFV
jgi:hypothetical protein